MMFRRIDEEGFFVEDVLEAGENIIDVPCADGFYLPRFNGTEWVEGKTQTEIDLIKSQATLFPTIEERVATVEQKVDILAEVIV